MYISWCESERISSPIPTQTWWDWSSMPSQRWLGGVWSQVLGLEGFTAYSFHHFEVQDKLQILTLAWRFCSASKTESRYRCWSFTNSRNDCRTWAWLLRFMFPIAMTWVFRIPVISRVWRGALSLISCKKKSPLWTNVMLRAELPRFPQTCVKNWNSPAVGLCPWSHMWGKWADLSRSDILCIINIIELTLS